MPTHSNWPTKTESDQLTADLLASRASAPGQIAASFLTPLIEYLGRKFPTTDPELCQTAAADAIFATIRRENNYDPNRLELGAFLRMVAKSDLLNLLRKEIRHCRGIPLESVAEPADNGNYSQEDEVTLSWNHPQLVAEMATFNPTDLRMLDMMRAGIRDTAAFASAMELPEGTPPQEVAEVVYRSKDRVKRRLTRAVKGAK